MEYSVSRINHEDCSFHFEKCLFLGENCEIDLNSDKCLPDICHSGSTCVSLTQGGFVCDDCSHNNTNDFYDRICQLRGRGFLKNSFLTFPSLKQRNRFHISLK